MGLFSAGLVFFFFAGGGGGGLLSEFYGNLVSATPPFKNLGSAPVPIDWIFFLTFRDPTNTSSSLHAFL